MSDSTEGSSRLEKIVLKDYAAGAFLAVAPLWILLAILPTGWSEESLVTHALITYFISMAGGLLTGYLIARKTGQNYLRAGLPTGLFAYSLYAVSMIFFGVRGGLFEDVPPLFGFLIGGAVGARLREMLVQKAMTRLEKRESHKKQI